MNGILGKKIGMTQVFRNDWRAEAVTVIQAGPCVVTQVKTKVKDGYQAVQVGFSEVKRLNKPRSGHLKRANGLIRYLREFHVDDLSELQVGQTIDANILVPGDIVDVTGTSKGRGFAGTVKRHGFRGGPKTHGQSDRWRAPGSIGAGTSPGKVWKGQKMSGHMGSSRVTTKNLEVVQVDKERNLVFIKGAVPGATNGLIIIRKTG